MDTNTNRINADATALERNLGEQPPIVCAYACIPEWPDGIGTHFEQIYSSPHKPKAEVDIDKVQDIVLAIKHHKERLFELDNLLLAPNNLIIVDSFDNVNRETLFEAEYETDIAKGILELIKSHHETEIEKLNDELIKVVSG